MWPRNLADKICLSGLAPSEPLMASEDVSLQNTPSHEATVMPEPNRNRRCPTDHFMGHSVKPRRVSLMVCTERTQSTSLVTTSCSKANVHLSTRNDICSFILNLSAPNPLSSPHWKHGPKPWLEHEIKILTKMEKKGVCPALSPPPGVPCRRSTTWQPAAMGIEES